ncbi:MAG: phosphoadenylyl-sulfate reductase [Flavobacteriaceae bacterium]
MEKDYLQLLNEKVLNKSFAEVFDFMLELKLGKLAFSTSFGLEDQVLTDFIFKNNLEIDVFTLDTGRLFEENYEIYQRTVKRYQKPIKSYFPESKKVEALLTEKGPFSFYESVENRKECCNIRKVDPLQRALRGVDLWITGVRGAQSYFREKLKVFEFDSNFGILKFNPLINWSLDEVERYLEEHNVPQNSLHKKGFPSIGCAPCTRAIEDGEDFRDGRWWWENSEKECGLHQTNTSKI